MPPVQMYSEPVASAGAGGAFNALRGLWQQILDLIPMEIEDSCTEQAENDRGHCGRPEDEDMRQDGPDHRSAEQGRADDLTVRPPENQGPADLDRTGHVAKPLAKANCIEGLNHHIYSGELCRTGGEEGECQESSQSK